MDLESEVSEMKRQWRKVSMSGNFYFTEDKISRMLFLLLVQCVYSINLRVKGGDSDHG